MSEQQSRTVVPLRSGASIKAIVPETIDDAWRLAQAVSASGLAPNGMKTPEQALVAIMHGMEIGLPPMQAMQRIAVINGRPSIWGDAIPAMLWASGFKIEEKELIRANTVGEVNGYQCTVTRPDGTEITRRFTEKDAKEARLWDTRAKVKRRNKATGEYYEADNDSPWFKYPKRMLQMRARGLAARDGAADVLMGLYLAEEAQDIVTDEPVVDITPAEDVVPEPGGDGLGELLAHPCFEPGEHRPIVNHYKEKMDGKETWNEVTGAINEAPSREHLAQLPDLYADEISGMPWSWAGNARDMIRERWISLEDYESTSGT